MLPIPQLLLFLPVCVFAGVAFTVAAIALITETSGRGLPAIKAPLLETPLSKVPKQSAQIIYFRPRKTSLRSLPSIDAPTPGRVFNGG